MYDHEYGEGWPCHGKNDISGDARSLHKPRLSRDMISYVESCFFLQVPIESICKMHIKKYIDIDSRDRDRDFFLY